MRGLTLVACLSFGCAGTVDGMAVIDGDPAVVFVTPSGETFVRDNLDDAGHRVAEIEIEFEVAGISELELVANGRTIARVPVTEHDTSIIADVDSSGSLALEARGLADGEVLTTATSQVNVAEPDFDCGQWMSFFDVSFTSGPSTEGIPEPVTATMPINGVAYRFVSNQDQRTDLLADCSLIRALADSAPVLRERGVTEVADIGIYNYRCIGGGTPPDCPNGVSQHAYAKAIDIAGYTADDGTFYSVNDDWIIDGDEEDTCAAATAGAKDEFLHEIICEQKRRGIWNIVLTPNYNAAHRDHFHVDLTTGSDFIGLVRGPVGH